MRVLVCDDDASVLVMLGVALADVELVEATRQAEAEVHASRGRLDGAIIDRRLPDGDGLALVRAIRRQPRTADVPVVVISAAYCTEDVEAVLASGADEYVAKPFEPLAIADLLRRLALLTEEERLVRRTLRRARAHAGEHSTHWDDLPELPGRGGDPTSRGRSFGRRRR